MVVEFIGNVLDLLLGKMGVTSRVWSLPLSEAGLLLKDWEVSL